MDNAPKNESGQPALEPDGPWWRPAVLMFARLSAWIAGPVLLAAVLGRWLDRRYDSEPWGLLGCVALAFVLSMLMIVVEAAKEYKKIERGKKN